MNCVSNIQNPNASRPLLCHWDKKYHETHGQSLQQTFVFHFEGVSYLLVVDYTSRFPVVHKLYSMTAQHVARHFRLIFLEYGWLGTLVSDNGPCYSAEVFTNLTRQYSVNHITNSLYYSQSNGLAENLCRLLRTCFIKQKKRGQIFSRV